jgi:hypothetical protein
VRCQLSTKSTSGQHSFTRSQNQVSNSAEYPKEKKRRKEEKFFLKKIPLSTGNPSNRMSFLSPLNPTLPFALHAAAELAAAASFTLVPERQLPNSSPEAAYILRSYAALLLSSSLTAVVFAARGTADRTASAVALALAVYHAGPISRARFRMSLPGTAGLPFLLRPAVHLVVHVGLLVWLAALGLVGLWYDFL